jgi:putative sterol carrier protein
MTDAQTPAETGGDSPDTDAPDFSNLTPEQFAGLIATASDEMIAEGMNGPGRTLALREIFGRMAEHVKPEKIKGQNAVIHFKILDRPDGGYDHFEVVFSDGEVSVSEEPSHEPRVTIKCPPVEFLKLISNQASGPALFMTGKLKLEGDIMYAAQITSFFTIPKAPGAPPAPSTDGGAGTSTASGEASV